MAGERTLVVNIIGDSASAQRAFAKTAASADAAASSMGRASKAVESTGTRIEATGKKISKVGSGLSKYVSLPLIGVGAAAVKMSLDFQKSMLLVETHTETSRKQVALYKREILDMASSGKFTQGPNEFAEAMYHIASDGYKGQKALHALRESANLAMLGQSNLAETTYAVVSAMKTGIKGTENLHEAIGTLNGTMGAGDTKMGELVAALSTGVVPAAKAAGLELTDVGAALAFLTARGIPAQKAAYGLAMNFQQLVPYSKKAKEAFEGLGIGLEELGKKAESGPMGWLKALEDLKQHFKAAGLDVHQETMAIDEIFGGGRTSRGILAQMQNLNDLRATYERLGVIAGRTDKNLKTARKSEANQWKEEWVQLQAALVELGNTLTPVLLPILKEVAHDVGDIAEAFESLPKPVQEWGVKLGLAAVFLGPVTRGVGFLVDVVGKATKAFEGMAAAEAAAGQAGAAGSLLGGAGAAGGATAGRWLGTEASQAEYMASQGLTVGMTERQALAAQGGIFGDVAGSAGGMSAGAMIGAAALPAAIAGIGIYKIATHTGHEMGDKIATGLGQEFEEKYGPNIQKALANKQVGRLEVLQKKLKLALNLAIASGASEASLKPLREKLGNLRTEIIPTLTVPRNAARSGMGELQGGLVTTMGDINHVFHRDLAEITEGWTKGGKQWRKESVTNMQAAVAAIETGMHKGVISTDTGTKRIKQLLRDIKLTEGTDPFHIAEGFASSWKKAGEINDTDISRAIREMQRMPKGAREAAQTAMVEMANGLERKGDLVKGSAAKITSALVTKFGASNKQMTFGVEKAVAMMAGSFGSLGEAVDVSLSHIGLNVEGMMKAFGISGGGKFASLAEGLINIGANALFGGGGGGGKGKAHHATGGLATVPGKGLHDTVPLFANGAMSAVVAPGEDLAVINRHQRPLLDYAVATAFPGTRGLGDFFAKNDKPHYMAKGGLHEPKIKGPHGALLTLGQAAVHTDFMAAQSFLSKHRPSVGGGAIGPKGVGTYMGVPMANWVIEALRYAAAHGSGNPQPTSGYRPGFDPFAPGGSEHAKIQYPGGAVDFGGMVDPAALPKKMAVVRATRGFKYPLLAPIGFRDDGHASGTGHARGGIVPGFAKGGLPSVWGPDQLATLAHWAGMPHPGLMAQIAEAESSGDPHAVNKNTNGTTDEGLWQINSVHGFDSSKLFDPLYNAKAAAKVLAEQGLGAWATYNSGAYKSQPSGHVLSTLAGALKGGRGSGGPTKAQIKAENVATKNVAVALPPLGPTALLPSAKALPDNIKGMLHSRGLDYAGKVNISEIALGRAEETEGHGDDEAVLKFQEELFKRNKKRLQKRLHEIDRELGKKNLSPKQRQRLLEQRKGVLGELGSVEGSLSGIRSTREGFANEEQEEKDKALEANTQAIEAHTQALKDLESELKQTREVQESELAVSSRTATRALTDLLSGELGANVTRKKRTAGAGTVGTT